MKMDQKNRGRGRKTGKKTVAPGKIKIDIDNVKFVYPSGPQGPDEPEGPHMRIKKVDPSSFRFVRPFDPRASRPLDPRASSAFNAPSTPHAPRPPLPPGMPKPMEERKSADMGRGDFIRSAGAGGAGILAAAIGIFKPRKKGETKE